ncbi:MAG TPA: DMT family transporter [Candidatus Angelobacter sp.]|jgi:transporter family protein|nr:DMT family transporter [Candidatus Angelobacter sp.]
MAIKKVLKTRWLRYSLFCVLLWGPYMIVSKLGAREIPAPTMQFLFTLGSLPVGLALLAGRRFKLEKERKGISYAILTGILSGIGGMGLFAAYGSGGNTAVITTATSLYPMVTVVLAVLFLRERLNWIQVIGLGFAAAAFVLFAY